jgi:hypothetical protein
MAFSVDETTGNITLIQGDYGELRITNLETDKNYTLCFAIQDEKRNPVGGEISLQTNMASEVIFVLTPTLTDLLTVKKNNEYETYYYGIKRCYENNFEDTLFIGNSGFEDLNTITVYPKRVEGTYIQPST